VKSTTWIFECSMIGLKIHIEQEKSHRNISK
jgi:hypothetical protein